MRCPALPSRQIADNVCQQLESEVLVRSVSRPVVVYPTLCLQLQFGMPHDFPTDRPPCSKPIFYMYRKKTDISYMLSFASQHLCVCIHS